MMLAIDEAFLPAKLTAPEMSDEQFAEFCAQYADYFIEMTADGEIVIRLPEYPLHGMRNGHIGAELDRWASRDRRGFAIGAGGCFVLPDGSRQAPDGAWIFRNRVLALNERELHSYWHLCPDFVIELRSQTDRLPVLRAKMQEWTDNGAQLAWLVDPERQAIEIYRPGTEPEIRTDIDHVSGEPPVEGFELDLRPVWNPLSL